MIDEEVVRPWVDSEALTQALQTLLKDTESAIRDRLSDEPALVNGGAIIDHNAPRERRFVAVEK